MTGAGSRAAVALRAAAEASTKTAMKGKEMKRISIGTWAFGAYSEAPLDFPVVLDRLAEHPVGSGDEETIDGDRVAAICSADWGLEHTIERNLERLGGEASRLRGADADVVRERIEHLREQIASHPKTRKWRMRALVGERMPWFEEPDEVADEH